MYDDYGPTLWHSTLVIIQGCLFINLLNLEGLVLLEEKEGLFGLFVIFKYRAVVERRLKEKLESLSVLCSSSTPRFTNWAVHRFWIRATDCSEIGLTLGPKGCFY
ncbi:unnamed protein product, partial [Vitis vinifera]